MRLNNLLRIVAITISLYAKISLAHPEGKDKKICHIVESLCFTNDAEYEGEWNRFLSYSSFFIYLGSEHLESFDFLSKKELSNPRNSYSFLVGCSPVGDERKKALKEAKRYANRYLVAGLCSIIEQHKPTLNKQID